MTTDETASQVDTAAVVRIRLQVRGLVQGVGFRPFVYNLAQSMGLAGWVRNGPDGVTIEVEGPPDTVAGFPGRLLAGHPPHAHILGMEEARIPVVGAAGFEIRPSEPGDRPTAWVLPDIATCPDCLADITDPANRRYRYPFTNCTNCGPRFTIIRALPYDRPHTTMADFNMCPACRAEYEDPSNRRFHAQPNACPVCGPTVHLRTPAADTVATADDALRATADALREGRIVAVMGLGGFHLVVRADRPAAVAELRSRKRRGNKPFAVMAPDLDTIRSLCRVSEAALRWLTGPEAPIVLLRRKPGPEQLPGVAPGNPCLGMMLPYTPLHHLLLGDLGFPVVATSGNVSDEPICHTVPDAMERLRHLADLFLVHNRPVERPVDDSIVRVLADRVVVLRRARGFAPWPVALPGAPDGILAVGGHLKNTCAVTVNDQAFISQHIGDLDSAPSRAAFRRTTRDLPRLFGQAVSLVAHDMHPDYASTVEAEGMPVPRHPVQHHVSHVLACMAENNVQPPVIGIAWDGTGYGPDGTVWGGEWFHLTTEAVRRYASVLPFPLPGGDAAVREPRRTAIGLLRVMGRDPQSDPVVSGMFSDAELRMLTALASGGTRSPLTSSIGRLFDGVAALLGLCRVNAFEGEAAMLLEFAATDSDDQQPYPLPWLEATDTAIKRLDWRPMLAAMLEDRDAGVPVPTIARRFHRSLVSAVANAPFPEQTVCFSGGCFQNALLVEMLEQELNKRGRTPVWHQRVPPNDGGIALGQLAAASIYPMPFMTE